MKLFIRKYAKIALTLFFGLGVFLFWLFVHPETLNFQEQNQLFLFASDYLFERLSVAGGLIDWISEFLVQFYYIPWLGAFILSLASMAFVRITAEKFSDFLLSFILPLLLLGYMGDMNVLLSYPLALLTALLGARFMRGQNMLLDFIFIPLLYWLIGGLAWMYVGLRIIELGWKQSWMLLYLLGVQLLAYNLLLDQWPLQSVMLGINYYRIPLQLPTLQIIIPLVVVALAYIQVYLKDRTFVLVSEVVCLVAIAIFSVIKGYDHDVQELLKQDTLVRNGQWDEIISRAESYQVKNNMSSESVNLALAMKRQLAVRMFDFYQSGEDALLMPPVRDNLSNIVSAEAYYHLGMVNSCLRYFCDLQESILNGRKSGRFEKRIIECYIINGNYRIARKHLDLLKESLFYRSWAEETEKALDKEALVNQNEEWSQLRRFRFKHEMLFWYPEIDKILGRLFVQNPDNKMALDYFMGEMLLKGNIQGFMQYMSWVQQYGGYQMMPLGYQDAARAIQSKGNAPGSAYAEYVKRMMANPTSATENTN
jgi:hypothetical protein